MSVRTTEEKKHETLKKTFWNMCFPVNFVKFLRTSFSQNTPGQLLLCRVIQVDER